MEQYKQKLEKIAYDKATYEKISAIADKYSLHIDQLGELTAEIRDILTGFRSSKTFTDDIIERLEIDRELANKITVDANVIISEIMKDQIQPSTTEERDAISSLEKLGGFSIEKSEGNVSNENSTVSNYGNGKVDVSEADRASILYGIENPVPGKKDTAPKEEPVMETESVETHTDPLIDRLLTNPVYNAEEKIQKVVPEAVKKPVEVAKPRGIDPYREPIK